MDVTTREGSTIALHDLGGEGASLLICHATGFCGRAYEPIASLLARHFHVWAVDLRGHGDSPPPADMDFAWAGIVEDVLAAASSIPGGPPHVVGHSMGGAVALEAEARHPGTFASAFVYEPIIVPDDGSAPSNRSPLADGARNRSEVFPSREAALWRYASKAPLDTLGAASLVAYVRHGLEDLDDGAVRLKCRAEHEARTFEAAGAVTTASVQDVALPVVVATGSEDQSPLARLGPLITASMKDATHVVYEHLGHFGPFQDLHRIAADIRAHAAP